MRIWIWKITFLILGISFGCASINRNPAANLDLVQPYSPSYSAPFKSPFVATFQRDHKTLKFISARHQFSIESETFKTTFDVIKLFDPQLLILEGYDDKGESSPSWMVDITAKCAISNYQDCGEKFYAINLTRSKNVPFLSGEPSTREIANYLNAHGFSDEDWIGFYIFRFLPQWNKQGLLRKKDIAGRIEKVGVDGAKSINVDKPMSYAKFLAWYSRRMGHELVLESANEEDFAPRMDMAATYLQRINYHVSIVTNRHLVQIIHDKLDHYDRVLVIYGSAHLQQTRLALADFLGEPREEKLY